MILRDRDLSPPWREQISTPLINIKANLYAKLETVNPTGSVKDRLIQHLIKRALSREELTSETFLVEATSGNTGISLSAIGAALGLKVKIIMPENMSEERRQMMKAFGAEIINVAPSDFAGAIELRNTIVKKNNLAWSPMQFENFENIECHSVYTAREIIDQLGSQNFGAFVSGAGTGGTIMGVRRAAVAAKLQTQFVLVQPEEDAMSHGIQGINDGANFLAKPDLMDRIIKVSTIDAKKRAERFAKNRGVLIGISAGANLLAAEKLLQSYKINGAIVTMLCDRGERYLSQ